MIIKDCLFGLQAFSLVICVLHAHLIPIVLILFPYLITVQVLLHIVHHAPIISRTLQVLYPHLIHLIRVHIVLIRHLVMLWLRLAALRHELIRTIILLLLALLKDCPARRRCLLDGPSHLLLLLLMLLIVGVLLMFGARVRIVLQAELVLFDLLLLLILMVHHAISTPAGRVDGVTAGLGRATQA